MLTHANYQFFGSAGRAVVGEAARSAAAGPASSKRALRKLLSVFGSSSSFRNLAANFSHRTFGTNCWGQEVFFATHDWFACLTSEIRGVIDGRFLASNFGTQCVPC